MSKGICHSLGCGATIELDLTNARTICPSCGNVSLNTCAAYRYNVANPQPVASTSAAGRKDDSGKDEPGLLLTGCNLAVAGVIAVLGFGFRKYQKRNGWKEVPEAKRRYKDAMHRHLAAIERGEILDDGPGGSGLPHIDHVACNAMFLSQMHHEGFGE